MVYQEVIAGTSLFGEENREKIGGDQAVLRNTLLCWPRVLYNLAWPQLHPQTLAYPPSPWAYGLAELCQQNYPLMKMASQGRSLGALIACTVSLCSCGSVGFVS